MEDAKLMADKLLKFSRRYLPSFCAIEKFQEGTESALLKLTAGLRRGLRLQCAVFRRHICTNTRCVNVRELLSTTTWRRLETRLAHTPRFHPHTYASRYPLSRSCFRSRCTSPGVEAIADEGGGARPSDLTIYGDRSVTQVTAHC